MNRSQDYYRHQRKRVINRKKKMIKASGNYWHIEHDGVLAKGKIHCSCWICSAKTWNHGMKISDARKKIKAKEQLEEFK